MAAIATPSTTKRYYSRNAGLTIHFKAGEYSQIGKTTMRVGEKHLAFTPFGKGVPIGKEVVFFGQFSSSDLEEIAYMEKRCADIGDVITEYDFNRLLVPPEDQIKAQEREIARLKSKLEDVLTDQGKKPRSAA